MSEELEWELYDIFESGLFAFPIWDHSSARKVVQYLLDRGVLGEEIADAIEDSTYDLDIWLNRGGKHMVGEWIIAWINECREEYDAEKLQEQYEMEEAFLRGTPQSSDQSDSEDDYGSDSEVRQLTEVEDFDYDETNPTSSSEPTRICDRNDNDVTDDTMEGDQHDTSDGGDEGAVCLPPPPARAAWRTRGECDDENLTDKEENEEGIKLDSEDDDDERNDHPPKNVFYGVVTNGEEKITIQKALSIDNSKTCDQIEVETDISTTTARSTTDTTANDSRTRASESRSSNRLTVTVSGATSSQQQLAIPDLRSIAPNFPDRNSSSGAKHLKPKLIPIKCSVVPPPGSPGFMSHLEKTGLPICPNCTCKLAHFSVDSNDNNCIDLYLTQSPAMEITINTLDKDGPGFIFILTDCLTQCLPWNTDCRYKVTSSRQPERYVQKFSKQNVNIEIIWQIRVQHHILACKEVHTYLQTFKLHTNWYKCPLKVIVETVSKVAKRFREE